MLLNKLATKFLKLHYQESCPSISTWTLKKSDTVPFLNRPWGCWYMPGDAWYGGSAWSVHWYVVPGHHSHTSVEAKNGHPFLHLQEIRQMNFFTHTHMHNGQVMWTHLWPNRHQLQPQEPCMHTTCYDKIIPSSALMWEKMAAICGLTTPAAATPGCWTWIVSTYSAISRIARASSAALASCK